MASAAYRLAGAFGALAIASLVAALALPPSCGIEGAYFDRSIKAPYDAGGVFITGGGLCWAPDLLAGAAAAFAICAIAVAVVGRRLRRRTAR
jgi:hypothetical protein